MGDIKQIASWAKTPERVLGLHFFSPVPVMPLIEIGRAICTDDDSLARAEALFEEHKRPEYAPPPLLKRMVVSGMHGRKSGRGFYEYE